MNFYTIYPSEHVDRDFSFYLKGNQDKLLTILSLMIVAQDF